MTPLSDLERRLAIPRKVTVTIEPREDGGLRVYSDEVPGLVLSHSDPDAIMRDVLPALRILLSDGEFHSTLQQGERP